MNDLMKATKLSKGAFYHHFSNKEEIFSETIKKYFFSDQSFNLSKDDLAGKPFIENIKQLLLKKGRVIEETEEKAEMESLDLNYFMLIFQAIRFVPGFKNQIREFLVKERQVLEEIITTAQHLGEIKKELNAASLAQHISNLLDGIELHALLEGNFQNLLKTELTAIEELYQLIKNE